jgi:hypothetical protein
VRRQRRVGDGRGLRLLNSGGAGLPRIPEAHGAHTEETSLNPTPMTRIALALASLLLSQTLLAQSPPAAGCERTRAEVRSECVEFLKTHRWDEEAGDDVSRSGAKKTAPAKLPEGVRARADIRAERDRFMRSNRWNEVTGQWEPVAGAGRDLSKLSRADVRKETQAFVRSYQWDEVTEAYVARKPR